MWLLCKVFFLFLDILFGYWKGDFSAYLLFFFLKNIINVSLMIDRPFYILPCIYYKECPVPHSSLPVPLVNLINL